MTASTERAVDSPAAAVERLGTDDWRAAYDALDAGLERAQSEPEPRADLLDAVLAGFDHTDPDVRKWCVALMDHHATARCIEPLRRSLHDPMTPVRRHAVHSVGCQSCKDDPLDIGVVGLLIERIEQDTSIRVRRAATHMLGNQPPDEDAREFLDDLLGRAGDEKLRRNARWAREQHRSGTAGE